MLKTRRAFLSPVFLLVKLADRYFNQSVVDVCYGSGLDRGHVDDFIIVRILLCSVAVR